MSLTSEWKPFEVEAHRLVGIAQSAFVVDAAKQMNKESIGALGVYSTDGGELVGIVTERDVTRCVAERCDPSKTHISAIMSTHPIGVVGHVTRAEAARIMKEGHVRHLIVREDDADKIISLRDV